MELPYERDAMRDKPLPPGLDLPDTVVYLALRYLYLNYRNGLVTRKQAAEEKESIIKQMETEKSKIDFLSRDALKLSERISQTAEEYRKNPSVKTADAFYAAIYNLPEDFRNGEIYCNNDDSCGSCDATASRTAVDDV